MIKENQAFYQESDKQKFEKFKEFSEKNENLQIQISQHSERCNGLLLEN
jgi:hypothetical protein